MTTARRLLLSPRAAADLEEIAEYIARDNKDRSRGFVAALEAMRRDVAEARLVPMAPGIRMAVHGRYLVLYRDLPNPRATQWPESGTPASSYSPLPNPSY